MPVEKSAGAIIFRKKRGKIYYLLLHYQSGARRPRPYWDFPKGHPKKRETLEEAACREVKEETGISDLQFLPGFKQHIKYWFKFKGKNIFKIVTFFLAKTKQEKVKISLEHIGYRWLPFKAAYQKLTFQNAKATLKKADQFLKKANASPR